MLSVATKIVSSVKIPDHIYVVLRLITATMDVAHRYTDTKISTYGAATNTLVVMLTDLYGFDKASSIIANVTWGKGEAWIDDLIQAIESVSDDPRYAHDCDECTFIGHINQEDCYHCHKHNELIRRYSSKDRDYSAIDVATARMLGISPWDTLLAKL